ncbi:MAG: IclR family transcriptional regulator [Chloroflexi bacterium]|nr:IclR family transcriptional regulator [Chloroflexota bacterium]
MPAERPSGPREPSVRVVKRIVDILDCLADGDRSLTLTAIAQRVGLHPSTVHRLLRTLEQHQLVYRYPDTDLYGLGYRLLSYGDAVRGRPDLGQLALPELQRLRDETEETTLVFVRAGSERVSVAAVRSPHELCIVPVIGRRMPLYIGSASKVILAHLEREEQERYLASLTEVDVAALRREIERMRASGYGVSISEWTLGAAAICAPIFRKNGQVVASLGVAMPVQRLTPGREERIAAAVGEAARRVSTLLGYDDARVADEPQRTKEGRIAGRRRA